MSYTATQWANGDIITAQKLNKIEDGVQTAYNERIPNVTYGTKTTIVNTTTVSFSKDGDNDWYISAANPISGMTFEEDTLYKVTWDDTEYDCFFIQYYFPSSTGAGDYSCNSVGNIAVIDCDNAYISDAPFFIGKRYKQTENNNIYILTTSTAASHTIKVEAIPYTKTVVAKQYYELTSYNGPTVHLGSGESSIIANSGLKASGDSSAAFGQATKAAGAASIAFGVMTQASSLGALSEGIGTKSTNSGSHSEGGITNATGAYSHAEGQQTTASGQASHAEGYLTTASGPVAHAEGDRTVASGGRSHAEGKGIIANHLAQHAFGQYNVADNSEEAVTARGNYIEIVGNGTADDARSNARTLDWSGNEALAGSLTLGKDTADEVTITPQQLTALLALLNP